MYCSQCGKKVKDTMLFCPFCGEPIVIPEQDEPAPSAPAADSASMEAAPEIEPIQPLPVPEEVFPESEPEPEPEPEKAAEAPRKPIREMGEAEAELLDWDRSRRQYASNDVWANPAEAGVDFDAPAAEPETPAAEPVQEAASEPAAEEAPAAEPVPEETPEAPAQ